MRCDWANFPGDDEPQQFTPKPCLPPGRYQATVEKVEEKAAWRPDDRNPSGDCLSIWLDVMHDADRYRIFETIPTNFLTKLGAIAAACGVPGPTRGSEEWDEQTLVGCKPHIETGTYVSKSGKNAGREMPKVVGYIIPEKPKAAPAVAQFKPAASRTPAAKVEKARVEAGLPEDQGDDIPF